MAYRPTTTKDRIAHRLKIVQGHLRKVQTMIDDDVYCIDVIHQSQAVQKALREVDQVILENHLQHCVAQAVKQGEQSAAIQEVMQVFRRAHT
jgi:DNA-binding FrmR family transcriptional regulator